MAFEGLADKLQNVFRKLTGKGKLSEADIKVAMREVKLALLEADVNFLVVKKFIKSVSEKAVGQTVLESLTPGQEVIRIVRDEMTQLLGGSLSDIKIASNPPTVILMAGLQGAGKTTMCGKLGKYFLKKGKTPMLVACDIYRPAAIQQLKVVGEQAGVPVFEMGQEKPYKIYQAALKEARKNGNDMLILDTAGRLHIDEEMMAELKRLRDEAQPTETLLVIDAMTGQDAVNAAKAFNEEVELTGVILTKVDGDTRGGAALSVREVTGKPIKFVGVGEKLTDIELFHPDRMTSRILGMGDMLSLIEKAEKNFDEKKALEMQQKMRSDQLNLNDFLEQMQQMKSMGSMQDILAMLPGGNKLAGMSVDEKQMARTEAIIQSMTMKERENPGIINGSRRKRIAKGSGVSVQDVNRLLNQFEQMKKMLKQFTGKRGKRRMMGLPF
ncbi:signal recognition particle protein [Christensenellaceae bacterium NSJ-63]|uniref:Signal recognition particle protein n=1 Tax=Guopingia tenuis TaxID=2763656 RepID=A0A926HVV5_9FIRM|nr:signal recognition particle protein [Guopingia tenuis]MBC8537693.1 signal recognition particle protein [Guopingia tenuis]MBS5644528.1 signal recognition particle protein [Clostridiales bacterium]